MSTTSTNQQPSSKQAACVEFSQHAWRPELCVNCQRPRGEHPVSGKPAAAKASARIIIKQSGGQEAVVITSAGDSNLQPVPNKRVSTLPRHSKKPSQEKPSNWKQDGGQPDEQTDRDKNHVNSHHRDDNDGVQKRQVRGLTLCKDGGSTDDLDIKKGQPRSILSLGSNKDGTKIVNERRNSRVAFVDTSPQVIGHDGGLESFFAADDDDDDCRENNDDNDNFSTDEASFSLTDEEKSFALLALENTVWNSDAENLLKVKDRSSGGPQRHSREFEDLGLDALGLSRHFQNLKDCDATRRFGTFPLRARSTSGSKPALDSVVFSSSRFSSQTQSSSQALAALDLEDKRSEVSDASAVAPSGLVKKPSSAAGDSGDGGSEGAYRVVSVVDDKHAYWVTDITSCLDDPSHPHAHHAKPHPHSDDSMSENSGSSRGQEVSSSESSSPVHNVKARGRSRPAAIRVSSADQTSSSSRGQGATEPEESSSVDALGDSATAAGLQVLALLNDVLENYGENESSTDDHSDPGRTSDKSGGGGGGGGKKSTDFEARMASVAAHLDLSKQQRAKRPAPRPPSSPPPEPSAVSPKKKSQSQPEPVFKMVTVGKGIMAMPPHSAHDLPRSSSQGLPSFDDLAEGEGGERSNGVGEGGRAKKGITSFFKNILRRGRDSQESLESSNPEVHFAVRSEVTSSSAPSLTEGAAEGMQRKGSDAASSSSAAAQGKVRVLPSGGASGVKGGSASTGDLPRSAVRKSESGEGSGEGPGSWSGGQSKPSSSPPSQPRSKGLSSPKQVLKRTTTAAAGGGGGGGGVKLSPPTQHKPLPPQHTKDEAPTPHSRSKPTLTSRKSDDREGIESSGPTTTTTTQPTPVRRRAKSPKRVAPPAPPPASRSGGGKGCEEGGGGLWGGGSTSDLTRELEQKLKSAASGGGFSGSTPALAPSSGKPAAPPSILTQILKMDGQLSAAASAAAARSDLRKSMTVPPPSPPTAKPQVSRSPPASPTPEESDSQPGSPTDEMSNSDESPRFTEKIELPTAAPGKKGILGKLNMNRKTRAPAPPSLVKRARSTSDAEKRTTKRINPADISGPVLVTDATPTSVLENRRNTISLGDDPAFSSAQSIEKGFDDLDMPILSPLGSLENLYEAILPKAPDGRCPFYDPPGSNTTRALCPNVPAEGYLEPVATPSAIPTPAAAAAVVAAAAAATGTESLAVAGDAEGKGGGGGVGSGLARSLSETDAGVRGSAVSGSKTLSEGGEVPGEGADFVEPELTEERRLLIASQPIYEEIPSYAPSPPAWKARPPHEDSEADTRSLASQITQMTDLPSQGSPVRGPDPSHKSLAVNSATLPHPKRSRPPGDSSGQRSRRSGSMSSHDAPPAPALKALVTLTQPITSSMTSALAVTSSSGGSGTTTTTMMSPFMTASMTSSLWHSAPSQPVGSNGELLPLPPLPSTAPRSISKETVSSESDGQSSTLSRPRPIPRRRPKRPDTAGSDQYVSMNRPNTQVTLGETKLRETYSRLTALNFQTLHDMYIQCERLLALEKISLPGGSHLKWADFDIYGQALHASGRCVVYNAKLRVNNTACQLMVLHSRPAAEMSQSTHPSLLRPAAIFADNVPFSFLTAEFIKTSQLLQNSVYDTCVARCFLAVGVFDIAESLSSHLTLLRETVTLTQDPGGYLRGLLMTTLQLLSALSHCLDRGFTVTETDLGDVFHIARPDLRGKVVAFLPHQRAPDVPQGEAMCGFLDRLLQEATNDYYRPDPNAQTSSTSTSSASMDALFPESAEEVELLSTVERLRSILEPRRLECLTHLRSVVEYILWGPSAKGLGGGGGEQGGGSSSGESTPLEAMMMGEGGSLSSVEQDHSAWLERERAWTVARFACSPEGLGAGVSLEDFYRLKFLLKSSATSLAECWRRLT